MCAEVKESQCEDRRSALIENHPHQRRREDQNTKHPPQPIEIRPRIGELRDPQHDQSDRNQQRDWVVHPVHRPEHHEQREDFDRRMQPMKEGAAIEVQLNRHQTRPFTHATNSSVVSASVPKRRLSSVISGARNDDDRSRSSCMKNSRTLPSKIFAPLRISTTRRTYSATSHGVCVMITIAIPLRLRSRTSAIMRSCSRWSRPVVGSSSISIRGRSTSTLATARR